jgi:hypothetical protein
MLVPTPPTGTGSVCDYTAMRAKPTAQHRQEFGARRGTHVMRHRAGAAAAAKGGVSGCSLQRQPPPARRALHTSLCPATQLARWHSLLHQRSGPPQPVHFWSGPPPGGAVAWHAVHVRGTSTTELTSTAGGSHSRAPGALVSAWSAARA